MERKRLLIFVVVQLVALLWSANGWSQDIVYKRDSKTIEAIIEEITDNSILYHKYDDPFGPIQKIAISKVAKIVYENGYEEVFNEKEVAAKIEDNLPIVIEQAPAPPKPKPQLEPPTQSLVVKVGIDKCNVAPRFVAQNAPVIMTPGSEFALLVKLGASVGLYNIDDSRWGAELSGTFAFGLKDLDAYGGELSGVFRVGNTFYPRVGGGVLICNKFKNAGIVGSFGVTTLIVNHIAVDFGVKYYPKDLVIEYERQVNPLPYNSSISYTYPEVLTAFSDGFYLTVSIGYAF